MKRSILMMLLAAMLGMAFVIPAQAAISWTCTFDFTASNGGWQRQAASSSNIGTYVGGATGWQSEFANIAPTGNASRLYLEREIDPTYITSISITHQRPSSTNGLRSIWTELSGVTTQHYDDVNNTNYPTGTVLTDTVGTSADTIVVRMNASSGNVDIRYTEIVVTGTGSNPFTEGTGIDCEEVEGYTRPYAAEDFHRFGMFNNSNIVNPQGIFAVSSTPNAHVSAPLDGTVDLVRRASIGDCEIFVGSSFFTACTVNFPAVINGTATDYLHGLTGVNPGVTGDITPWLVRITSDTTRFFYLVENADKYVVEGQTVTAGCWIGESMRLTTSTLDLGATVGPDGPDAEFGLGRGYADYGLTIITVLEGGTRVDALEDFTEQPTINAPCNLPEGFEGCEGDSSLSTPGQWVSIDSQWRESGGVTISAGGYIKSQMNLDPAREPGLKVGVRAIGSNTTLALTLGETSETVSLTASSGFTRVEIAPDEHNPDGDFYTIEIKNTGSGTAELNYVCVYHSKDGEGDPIEPPQGPEDTPNEDNPLCKFADYSFDAPSGVWTLSSGETATGEIRIPASATVSQSVSIPAGTYTLSVVASVWHYSAFVPDDTDTDTITFEYDFPADTTYTTISAKTFGQYAENNNSMVHSVSLVLGSDTSGTFTFRPIFSDTPTNVRGVIIRSICVGSEQSGTGGQSGSGTGGSDWEGPFETSCTAISTPTGSSAIGTWARWSWAKLNGFFQCELMVILNAIYNGISRAVLTMGWAIRYNIAVTNSAWDWAGDALFPWLAGYLSNIQPAVVRGDTQETCNNLFCGIIGILDILRDVLDQFLGPILDFFLRLLSLVVDIVFLVLNGLLSLIFQLLNVIVGLLVTAVQLITSLILAWNGATPTGLPGLHDCVADPNSVACGVFWLMEHTIFSGTEGALIIPLIASFLHIMTIIKLTKRLLAIADQAQGAL